MQAVRGNDSKASQIQLAVEETVTRQVHAGHFQTLPMCLVYSHGITDFNRKVQPFELKVL